MDSVVQWLPDGSPRSRQFDDIYRSRHAALAQANQVFLAGCGLPHSWAGRTQFSILETGFGLGLNFLASWAAWQADPARCDTLRFISVEAFPVTAQDILRSARTLTDANPNSDPVLHAASARIAPLATALAAVWPSRVSGINPWVFDNGQVQLTLYVGQVLPMLQLFHDPVDAVFLDGFSPALNPDMWCTEALQAVAKHCRGGTRLATYTVAGSVRRTLQTLGFTITKKPGLPPKRDRLEAVMHTLDRLTPLPGGFVP